MSIYTYMYMYIYVYTVYICLCIYTYVFTHIHVHTYINTYIQGGMRASSPCFARQPAAGQATHRPPTAMVCSWRRDDLAIGAKFCRIQRGLLLHISPPVVGGAGPRAKGLSTCSMKTKQGEPYDPPNINRMQTDDSDEWTPQGPTLFVPAFDMEQHVAESWTHWEKMGSPRFVMAPMGTPPPSPPFPSRMHMHTHICTCTFFESLRFLKHCTQRIARTLLGAVCGWVSVRER